MHKLDGILVSVKDYPISPAWVELGLDAFRDAARVTITRAYPGVEVVVISMTHQPPVYFVPNWGKPVDQVTGDEAQTVANELQSVGEHILRLLGAVNEGSSEPVEPVFSRSKLFVVKP